MEIVTENTLHEDLGNELHFLIFLAKKLKGHLNCFVGLKS